MMKRMSGPLVLACVSLATQTRAQDLDPGTVGARGVLEGESGHPMTANEREDRRPTSPPMTANEREDRRARELLGDDHPLVLGSSWLASHGARRIEDLDDDAVLEAEEPPDGAPAWRARLADLAKAEAKRRGLEDGGLPLPPVAAKKEEPPAAPPKTKYDLTDEELEILARIVKGEAWPGSSLESHVAIAAVVLNRMRAPGFPKTVEGVAHQPWQFSSYNPDLRTRLYLGPIPAVCWEAARAAAAGEDPTGGATYYFNPYLVKPEWASRLRFVKRIGTSPLDTHDFYVRP